MSPMHKSLQRLFDCSRASGETRSSQISLSLRSGLHAGPFPVDFLDVATGVVVDVEYISWPVALKLRHRMLRKIGYIPIRLDYWEFRRARSDTDRLSMIAHKLKKLRDSRREMQLYCDSARQG